MVATAAYPFDDLKADIILHSTLDNVNFHVQKQILALASPVFKDMFELASPTTDEHAPRQDVPVVPLTESRNTLDPLLRFCYPCGDPSIDRLEDVHPLLEAARKYQMTGVTDRLARMMALQFAQSEPVRTYALACAYALPTLAHLSAKLTLPHSLARIPFTPEMSAMSTLAYHRLFEYRWRCCDVASSLVGRNEMGWVPRDREWTWFGGCSWCRKGKTFYYDYRKHATVWWEDYLKRAEKALREGVPWGTTVTSTEMLQPAVENALECETCSRVVFQQMKEFSELLAEEIEKAINTVKLELPF